MNIQHYSSILSKLYQQELQRKDSDYIRAHSQTQGALARQLTAASWYLPYVHGRVLDWGCMHAADACLMRAHCGDEVEIHGCDVYPAGTFPVFHDFAKLQYRLIDHAYQLPYPDGYFDVVVGDGVLEHVPNDRESLKEVYRVLKTGGVLVLACLPNRWSYIEALARCLGVPHHLRRYGMGQINEMLLHSGFMVFDSRRYQMLPSFSGMGMVARSPWLSRLVSCLWHGNVLAERLWPVNRLASNLFLIARKVNVITWELRPTQVSAPAQVQRPRSIQTDDLNHAA